MTLVEDCVELNKRLPYVKSKRFIHRHSLPSHRPKHLGRLQISSLRRIIGRNRGILKWIEFGVSDMCARTAVVGRSELKTLP